MAFFVLKALRRWYFALGSVLTSLLDRHFLPGFQHCSVGFSSGVYLGKYSMRNVFLWELKNASTFFPWCAGALSMKRRTLPQRFLNFSIKRTKSFCLLVFEKEKTKLLLLRAPNTLVLLLAWFMQVTGLLPLLAQPLATRGIRPKVASSSAPTIKPFLR